MDAVVQRRGWLVAEREDDLDTHSVMSVRARMRGTRYVSHYTGLLCVKIILLHRGFWERFYLFRFHCMFDVFHVAMTHRVAHVIGDLSRGEVSEGGM